MSSLPLLLCSNKTFALVPQISLSLAWSSFIIMCFDIIFFKFLVLGFVELFGSKFVTTYGFIQRKVSMSTICIDKIQKVLNDAIK